jgi:hypothetical protein
VDLRATFEETTEKRQPRQQWRQQNRAVCTVRKCQPDDLRANLPVERSQPIFMAHGQDDTMVSVECSRRVVEFLTEEGYRPIYLEYPMGHEINEELLAELTIWITKTLSPRLSGSR